MSLMECPECKNNISELADDCPNCGYPLADEEAKKEGDAKKKKGLAGFVEFIRKQGVVGLAIGFIIGVATATVVTALIGDFINPVIGLIIGQANLDTLTFTVSNATFNYGHFISVLINFAVILAVIYFGFKALRLEKLDVKE
jgi:large conductance mechanosensitive channel